MTKHNDMFSNLGEWQRMSLPAMLLGETVGEILQASQFTREIIAAIAPKKTNDNDPKTPLTVRRIQRFTPENSELSARRKREKQAALQSIGSEPDAPRLQRAKSRINFKVSPPRKRENDQENNHYVANRVSPRNKPWAKKTVLFPNPLFHSSHVTNHYKFSKTESPVMAKNRQTTPLKFSVKSPASSSKFQVKVKSPPCLCHLQGPPQICTKNLQKYRLQQSCVGHFRHQDWLVDWFLH